MKDYPVDQKRVLLLGSSFSSIPILHALLKAGLHVSVCGNLSNDPAHALADQSFYVDYSDENALAVLMDTEHFDFVCPTCNDFSYLAGAKVAAMGGLPGYDTAETVHILHDKDAFRRFATEAELPVPRLFGNLTDLASSHDLHYPLLVKPVDSFSGRGVTRVDSSDELKDAMSEASSESRSKGAIAEEFVEGELFSHSCFIRDGRLLVDFFADEFCTVYPYQVDCSNVPTSLPKALQEKVQECVQTLVTKLDLVDGLLHTQIISNGTDFWLIECMRRAPGDLYYEMIRRSCGVDGMELYALPFIGQNLPYKVEMGDQALIARHTVSVNEAQQVYSFSENFPGDTVAIFPLKLSGEILRPAPFDKLGIIFSQFDTLDELHRKTRHLASYVKIDSILAL